MKNNFCISEDSLLNIKLPLKPHENIILLSPVFPPPPDYNNDKASALFESCKVRKSEVIISICRFCCNVRISSNLELRYRILVFCR